MDFDNRPMTAHLPPTPRAQIRRGAKNADYDPRSVRAIIDDAYVCQVSFVAEDGGVHGVPTQCWRDGDHLVIPASMAAA